MAAHNNRWPVTPQYTAYSDLVFEGLTPGKDTDRPAAIVPGNIAADQAPGLIVGAIVGEGVAAACRRRFPGRLCGPAQGAQHIADSLL